MKTEQIDRVAFLQQFQQIESLGRQHLASRFRPSQGVDLLENFLEKKEGSTKGVVVLATVYGDVHDIGKNLVKTILSNNGYTVFDLGKQVPVNVILDKAVEVKADAIGLSALLVSTSKQMPVCLAEQDARGSQLSSGDQLSTLPRRAP